MIFPGTQDARWVKITVPTVTSETTVTETISDLGLPVAYNDSEVLSWMIVTSAGVVVVPTGGKCLQAAGTITVSEPTAGFVSAQVIYALLQIGTAHSTTGTAA